MKKNQEQMLETRQNIVAAASREFRKNGYEGTGVDGLAKEAGVTSGAFYGHFKSKNEVFLESITQGLEDYRRAITHFREKEGENWVNAFLEYYLGEKHRRDLEGGCAVPSLSSDVVRSNRKTRAAYAGKLAEIVEAMAEGLPGKDRNKAYALIALLGGAVMIERSVDDEATAREIAEAAEEAAHRIIQQA